MTDFNDFNDRANMLILRVHARTQKTTHPIYKFITFIHAPKTDSDAVQYNKHKHMRAHTHNCQVAFPWGCGMMALPDGQSMYTISHAGKGLMVNFLGEVLWAQ